MLVIRKYLGITALVLTLVLITYSVLPTQAEADLGTPYPRHSPDIILKIKGSSISNLLKDLISEVNPNPLLGSGVKPLGSEDVRKLVNTLSSNPSLSTSLSNEDIQKLAAVTSATGTSMPPELRYDLSLAASLVKNPTLKEILKEWASKGYINLNELRSRVDLSKLSRDDLAVLKALLGLAAKYGLVSKDDLSRLGLGNVSPEDIKALADVLKKASELAKSTNSADVLKKLANILSKVNVNTSLLASAFKLVNNANAPHIGKALLEGIQSLSKSSTSVPKLPYIPRVSIPNVPKLSVPKVSNVNVSSGALLPIILTIATVVATYLAYRFLGLKSVIARIRKEVKLGIEGVVRRFSGINAEVIKLYWEGVAYLSRVVPKYDSETHREYLRKAYGLGGEEFKELTQLYELARWSGKKLLKEHLVRANELLGKVKAKVLR